MQISNEKPTVHEARVKELEDVVKGYGDIYHHYWVFKATRSYCCTKTWACNIITQNTIKISDDTWKTRLAVLCKR